MSGGRFFNSLGYGEGTPNTQSNNLNGNQNAFIGSGAQNSNARVPSGTPMSSSNPLMNGNNMNNGNPMTNGNPMNGNVQMNNGNPMNGNVQMNNGNSMNNGNPMQGMSSMGMQSPNNQMNNPMNGGGFGNQVQNNNQMNNGNPFGNQQNSNMNQMNNNAMQNMNPMGGQQNPMNGGNTMNNGNPMQGMNPMGGQQNPMNVGNPMNVNGPMNNGINNMGFNMNNDMAAAQYTGALHQDPVPSNMSSQNNPMMNNQTGANQGFLGGQQNPMSNGKPMNGPMNNGNPFGNQQNNMNQMNNNSMPNMNPMNMNNGPMNNTQMNNNQQQMITMDSNVPGFNNSLNGISPLDNPIATQNNKNLDLSMKPKLKMDFKKIFIVGVVILAVVILLLCLLCSKTVKCTHNMDFGGAKVTTTIKADYWFNKINKITTTIEIDISKLDENEKNDFKEKYGNDNSGAKVEIDDNYIVITSINKPTSEDKEKGSHEESPSELIDDYESIGFVCK